MPISDPAPEPTAPAPRPDPGPDPAAEASTPEAATSAAATSEPAADPTAAGATADPEDEGEGHGRPLWLSWAIAAAVVAALAGAAVFLVGRSGDDGGADAVATAGTNPAAAAAGSGSGGVPGAGFGPGARGTITAIDGATITVESNSPDGSSGTTTVATTDETAITESVDASLDDFEVGDSVVVFGDTADDGTVAASTVSEGDGGGFGGPQAGGGLPDGFQPPADGQVPDGFQPPADGELPDGFQPPADGELPEGFQPPQGGAGPGVPGAAPTSGEITAISDDSLTVESDDGSSVTVSIDDDTTFTVTEDRSIGDLAEGDTVVVVGEAGDDDVVTATSIRVGDGLGFGAGGPGGPPGATATTSADGAGA